MAYIDVQYIYRTSIVVYDVNYLGYTCGGNIKIKLKRLYSDRLKLE